MEQMNKVLPTTITTTYNLSEVPTEQLQIELDKRKSKEQLGLVPTGPPLRILNRWEGW